MTSAKSLAIPKETISYLLFSWAGIVAVLLLVIYPSYRSIARLDREISQAKERLSEHKELYPVYAELVSKGKAVEAALLPPGPKTGLAHDQVGKIAVLLGDVARKSGLSPVSVTADPKSLEGDSCLLAVQVGAKGDFFSLRTFLLELQNLPYMNHLDELQVQDGVAGDKDFKLKMKLQVDK